MTSTTTSQYAPIGYSTYNYSYVQTIIDSAFMAEMQGDITAFAFNVSTASAGDYFTGMNVYMANVSESSLSGFITPDSAHQFVEVIHNGDFTFTTTGWQLFGFDSTFTWDGHSNVLFAVNRNHGSWSSGAYFHAHNTTGASKTYYAYQDSGPISITSPSADYGNTTLAYTGDIMLVSCGGGCRVPGAVSFNNVTYNAATANWSGSATDYEVSVKAANEAIWPEATPVTGNTFAISNLAPATQYQFRVRAISPPTVCLASSLATSIPRTLVTPLLLSHGLQPKARTSGASMYGTASAILTMSPTPTRSPSLVSATAHVISLLSRLSAATVLPKAAIATLLSSSPEPAHRSPTSTLPTSRHTAPLSIGQASESTPMRLSTATRTSARAMVQRSLSMVVPPLTISQASPMITPIQSLSAQNARITSTASGQQRLTSPLPKVMVSPQPTAPTSQSSPTRPATSPQSV